MTEIDYTARGFDPSEVRTSWGVALSRALCGLVGLFWLVVFIWLWIGAPPLGRMLGLLWFALGAALPRVWMFSLLLALPFFGNNPGGPHHLYLLEMGLMGLVVRYLAERALGITDSRRSRMDRWVRLFAVYSFVCLIPQARWIWCEWLLMRGDFMFAIFNHYGTAEVFGLQMALKLGLAVGLYSWLRDKPWLPQLQRAFWQTALAVLALSAVAGLLDYVGAISLKFWRGENPDIVRFGYKRLQSLYWHSGWYAQYLIALAPAALALALVRERNESRAATPPFFRGLGWALTILLGVACMLTMQRAGWLALTAGYAVVVLAVTLSGERRALARKLAVRGGLALGGMAGMAAVLCLMNPDFFHRITELGATHHRTDIWRSAWGLFEFSPLTGVGIGNYNHAHRFFYPEGHEFFTVDKVAAHSLYIHLLATRGLIGMGLLAVILCGVGIRLWRAIAHEERGGVPGTRLTAMAIAGGMAALLTDGVFQYIFYVRAIDLLFWILVGMSCWLRPQAGKVVGKRETTPVGMLSMVIVTVFLTVLVTWGNQYSVAPWSAWVGDGNYTAAGKKVELPLPPNASRVVVPLATMDPAADLDPVRYTLSYQGEVVLEFELGTNRTRRVELDLPLNRPPDARLTVEVSRTWAPYAFGQRFHPLMNLGVMYQDIQPASKPTPSPSTSL